MISVTKGKRLPSVPSEYKWLLITEHHDIRTEWFKTKSEACVRAIEHKGSFCQVIGVSSIREFNLGKKIRSY